MFRPSPSMPVFVLVPLTGLRTGLCGSATIRQEPEASRGKQRAQPRAPTRRRVLHHPVRGGGPNTPLRFRIARVDAPHAARTLTPLRAHVSCRAARFPDSLRVRKLEAMMWEAKDEFELAMSDYENILKDDPNNLFALKRQVMPQPSLSCTYRQAQYRRVGARAMAPHLGDLLQCRKPPRPSARSAGSGLCMGAPWLAHLPSLHAGRPAPWAW